MTRRNWDSYKHQRLYNMIHGDGGFFGEDGAGVAGATGAQDAWAELATLMRRARERTDAVLAKAGASWEGEAADSMRSGVSPLAQWADDAATAAQATQSSVDVHTGSFSAAQHGMPEPVPVTSTANSDAGGIPAAFTHLFGGQTDQDAQEAAAQEAKAEAVRVMSSFDDESGAAESRVGEHAPPPSVTLDVPPPQPTKTDIDTGTSEPPGPGATGGDGSRSAGDTGSGTDTRSQSVAPPPGSTSTPPGTTVPNTTTPSATPVPTAPSSNLPVGTGPHIEQRSRVANPLFGPPGGGNPGGGRATGGGPGGAGSGRGVAGGPGGGPGAGRSPGGPGAGRGASPGFGAPPNEGVAGRSGAAGARGAGGMGVGPVGAGRGQGDEDKEHQTPTYLHGTHDSFWDDTDPVAPPVIGEDDD